MIATNYKFFEDQLKAIDAKSYEWPWFDEGWKTAKDYNFRILLDGSRVIGFSCFKDVFLAKLCVHPVYRKLGYGSKLMSDLLLSSKGQRILTILHEENEYLTWAKNWGWYCIGLEKNLFPDGRDGLKMVVQMKPLVEGGSFLPND